MANQLTQSTLFRDSLAATFLWLENEWSKYSTRKLNTGLVRNMGDLRSAAKTIDIQYPFALCALGRIAVNAERGGLSSKFRVRHTGSNMAAGTGTLQRLVPVQVGLGITFRTDDINDVINFSQLWLMSAPKVSLLLQGAQDSFQIETSVNIDPELELPEADIGAEGKPYVITAVMSINTYIGSTKDVGLIKTIKVRFDEANGSNSSSVQEDIEINATNVLEVREYNFNDLYTTTSPAYKGDS